MRVSFRRLLVGAAVVAVAGGVTTPAYAATALPPMTFLLRTTPDTHTFSTTLQYWSAVAVRPASGLDEDLRLTDANGAPLASSVWGTGATDVIAINSTGSGRPLGGYRAVTTQYSGSGTYSIMHFQERVVVPVPTDPIGGTATAWGIRFDWPVAAYMIQLAQGQGFRVNHGPEVVVMLAGSTPGVPSTYVRTRSQMANAYVVADNVLSPTSNVCRYFVAPAAGWYSVILVWATPWTPPPYNGGQAVFPQRYNPALGDTLTACPQPSVP